MANPSISVLSSDTGSVTITWDAMTGADSYVINALRQPTRFRRPVPVSPPIPPQMGRTYTFSTAQLLPPPPAIPGLIVSVMGYANGRPIGIQTDQIGVHVDPGPNPKSLPRSRNVGAAIAFNGVWVLHADGHISTPDTGSGRASFYGEPFDDWGNTKQWAAIVAWPSGHGYWCTATDGTIFEAGQIFLDLRSGESLGAPPSFLAAPPMFPVGVPVNTVPPQTLQSGPVIGMQIDPSGPTGGYYVLTDVVYPGFDFSVIFGCCGGNAAAGLGLTLNGNTNSPSDIWYDFPYFPGDPLYNPSDPTVAFCLRGGGIVGAYAITQNGYVGSVANLAVRGQAPGSQDYFGILVTPSGEGYWVMSESAGLIAFGDAVNKPPGYTGQTFDAFAASPDGQEWYLILGDTVVFAT